MAMGDAKAVKCSLKTCNLSLISTFSARAEVKTVVPKGGLSKFKQALLVNWKKNGEAVFHRQCWENLLSASQVVVRQGRVRKRKADTAENGGNNLTVTKSEKVMIEHASETVEMFDSVDDIKKKAGQVAKLLKEAGHCVFFTGAGISTSAGMGDFRGKDGKWTEMDREAVDIDSMFEQQKDSPAPEGTSNAKKFRLEKHTPKENDHQMLSKKTEEIEDEEDNEGEEEDESVDYEALRPTFTHEAIKKLIDMGHIKYLISQNCDGLHLLSGVPPDLLSSLHGDVFVEKCEKCGTRYERPYYVCDDISDIYLDEMAEFKKSTVIVPPFMLKCRKCGMSHRTGRRCEQQGCDGQLIDTIINFRDDLEKPILDKAFAAAKKCDLVVCLGTTLTVTPAAYIVDMIKRPRKVVICNRQATDRDEDSVRLGKDGQKLGVRIYGDCDVFMKEVMKYLLGESEYQAFETSLPDKKEEYNTKRQMPPK